MHEFTEGTSWLYEVGTAGNHLTMVGLTIFQLYDGVKAVYIMNYMRCSALYYKIICVRRFRLAVG